LIHFDDKLDNEESFKRFVTIIQCSLMLSENLGLKAVIFTALPLSSLKQVSRFRVTIEFSAPFRENFSFRARLR